MTLFRSDLATAAPPADLGVPRTRHMMCLNESTLEPVAAIGEKVFARLRREVPLNRYFNPVTSRLREALAEYVGHGVAPRNLLFGNGADEMLYAVFVAVRENPGDFAVSLAPSYFDYKTYCDAVGLGIRFVEFGPGFTWPIDAYLDQATAPGCKLAILCNPNNPTGHFLPDAEMRRVLTTCRCPVLIDETYFEFSGRTCLDWLTEFPNLIVVRSFSKAFAGAGLRFGYLVSSEANVQAIKKVMTIFHSSLMVQAFALTMIMSGRSGNGENACSSACGAFPG
jgi:histidinol-phosphate aminotransferase